ncbi:MAG: N-acetylornithine carbamoyltransferase [Gammaproteobacteria bacterium]|nr:N-acetylornithine carbamoyltransferase [Gammaproteobacteria bacterium]MDE2345012.1 N-acetylornithine carbamoyltransferase [Gammaproteobacteria bacterium]
MKHFTRIADLGVDGVAEVLQQALAWKTCAPGAQLAGKLLGMVFFNPSLRTRASFEAAMLRGGGNAIVLDVGGGVWKLEDRSGAVMDGDRPEHIREAIPVLGRYVDALAVRTFGALQNDDADAADPVMNAFRELAGVPVISMESAREHPCQGLADLLTVRELLGDTRKMPVTLTWAPHIKALPKAVPHSFLLTAAAAGCEVRIAHPPDFELHPAVLAEARGYAANSGGSVTVTSDQQAALKDSRVVYAKAWGPATRSVAVEQAAARIASHKDWLIGNQTMAGASHDALFLHCLPVRRNVEVADEVLDGGRSRVIDEAENRFHVQRVLLHRLLN